MNNIKRPYTIPFPSWLQTLLWAIWPIKMINFVSRKYPEPFILKMVGGRKYIFVNSPEFVKEVFTKFPAIGNEELRPFLGNNSLFLLQGNVHGIHRKKLSSNYHGDLLNRYSEHIKLIARKHLSAIKNFNSCCLHPIIQSSSLEIIIKTIFTIENESDYFNLSESIKKVIQLLNGPLVFFPFLQKDFGRHSPGRKIKDCLKDLDDLILSHIIKARNSSNENETGVLFQLVKNKDYEFSDQEIIDEIKTLLAAGHEPSTAAIMWSIYWICSDDSVYKKLRKEIFSSEGQITGDLVRNDNTYLDAICKETLRILPVVPAVDRTITENTECLGYLLLPKERIVACSYLTQRRSDIFENPDKFYPDRFFNKNYSPFEFYPFGGGNRRCIGAAFAMLQIKLFIQVFFSMFEVELLDKKLQVLQKGVTLGPSNYKVKLKRIID